MNGRDRGSQGGLSTYNNLACWGTKQAGPCFISSPLKIVIRNENSESDELSRYLPHSGEFLTP